MSMAALFRGCWNFYKRSNKHVELTLVSCRSMASKTPVGFIGLGNMGTPMARNLLKHGYPVIATDVFPESCKEFQDSGAQVLCICFSNNVLKTKSVTFFHLCRLYSSVYELVEVIALACPPRSWIALLKWLIKLTASSPCYRPAPTSLRFTQDPMAYLSVGAASLAKLTFMVGGVEEEFNAAQELLTCMGANVVYCGQVGSGQAAKICNNMLLAIGMIGTAETMNLGIRLGLDPKLLAKILNMSSGRCWSSDKYNPVPGVMEGVPSANNYQGGFGTKLMAKDLGFAQNTATSTRTPIPLGSLAHQIYRTMCAHGYSNKDFSSVFQFLREEEVQ
uniref:3-hydroxyisobutyrate dehydrogenase n=1 Tax=Cyprinus carpio carpio TaxID=630221 RepID=A0A9J8AFH1_CYPCA